MIKINWDEYKHFKTIAHSTGDNFDILLEFLKSYYNMTNPQDLYETLSADDLALMMLQKRELLDAASLEHYIMNI